jgi:hypothetical protein
MTIPSGLSATNTIYGSTALCSTLAAFSVSQSYSQSVGLFGRGIRPSQGPLPPHRTTETQNKGTQTSMPWVGLEPTIRAFERAKTVHASHRAATAIGVQYTRIWRRVQSASWTAPQKQEIHLPQKDTETLLTIAITMICYITLQPQACYTVTTTYFPTWQVKVKLSLCTPT